MTATAAHLSLYDGREHMGTIVDNGESCKASDVKGKKIGTFTSRKEAIAAIAARYRAKGRKRARRGATSAAGTRVG